MEDVDIQEISDLDEDELFLRDVAGDEHELLFLDSYLRDVFRGIGTRMPVGAQAAGSGGGVFEEEATI